MNPQDLTEEQRKELEEKLKNMSPEELMEFQKQQCIFCQLISGKIPSKKIFEDDTCIVILDINPATKGHLLLIPKEHYAIMPQIPEKEIKHLFTIAKKMSQLLLKALKVSGTSVFIANGLVAGQKAQHFMIHIIPRKDGDGIFNIEERLIDSEMIEKVASLVEVKFNELMGIKKEVLEVKTEEKEPETKEVESEPEEADEEKESEDETEDTDKEEPETEEKESEVEEEPKKNVDKEDASLDDIANLFK
jgi:histidine triad (HIT) family protein